MTKESSRVYLRNFNNIVKPEKPQRMTAYKGEEESFIFVWILLFPSWHRSALRGNSTASMSSSCREEESRVPGQLPSHFGAPHEGGPTSVSLHPETSKADM